jgi:hypothetical protein
MNAYFFKMTNEEKENILDKHKSIYDGFVTQYAKPEQQPLYIQDYANDKGGLTVNNKGNVSTYKNVGINEDVMSGAKFEPEVNIESEEVDEQLDMIGDGEDDFEHGTFNYDDEFFEEVDEDMEEPLREQVEKSLDMFKRFRKY